LGDPDVSLCKRMVTGYPAKAKSRRCSGESSHATSSAVDAEDTNIKTGDTRNQGRIAKSERTWDKHLEVLADHSTDVRVTILAGRWGSETLATHCREGEAGRNVFLEGTMGDTQKSQTISTENQGIASQVIFDYLQVAKLCANRGVA